jgi:RNA polymerase sigma factor (TIGR02999 family)
MAESGEITRILAEMRGGRSEASDRLIPLVHLELKRIAQAHMSRERADHLLQPPALVNEAWLRLIEQTDQNWQNRTHFFGVAAHLMRLILVDHARNARAKKRGGGEKPLSLDQIQVGGRYSLESVLVIDQALEKLAQIDERAVRVVELRVFAELTVEEAADVLGVADRTVKRDWKFARAWLAENLAGLAVA